MTIVAIRREVKRKRPTLPSFIRRDPWRFPFAHDRTRSDACLHVGRIPAVIGTAASNVQRALSDSPGCNQPRRIPRSAGRKRALTLGRIPMR